MNLRSLTLAEIKKIQEEQLTLLLKEAGTTRHLSFMLDVPFSTVTGWIERGRISKNGAETVEKHKTLGEKFKARDLRPDITI